MPKILIVSVSAGNGHKRAAEALAAQLELDYPTAVIKHVDLMTIVSRLFRFIYKDCYIKLVQYLPPLWHYMYMSTNNDKKPSFLDKMRRAAEAFFSSPLKKYLKKFDPDIIVVSHFLPAQVLKRWQRKGAIKNMPIWEIITDFDAHRYWLEPGLRGYFVAFAENVFRLKMRHLENERIELTGIPVMPEFSASLDRLEAQKQLGLDPQHKNILLMPGGDSFNKLEDIAAGLLTLSPELKVVVVCGRNKKLFTKMTTLSKQYQNQLMALPFTSEMPKIMTACDLIISKPGGLTTSECLALGKPLIALSPIPGQEEANTTYLLEHGVALRATDLSGLLFKVKKLLDNWECVAEMGNKAKALGRLGAAREVAKIIMDDIA